MMISTFFVIFLTCLFTGANGQKIRLKSSSSIQQRDEFLTFNVGETVTLECSFEGDQITWISWYKQTFGLKPELICSFYVHSTEGTFYGEFKNNARIKLDARNQNHYLKISKLQFSDSATYYCAGSYAMVLHFPEGVTVNVKGSGLTVKDLVVQSSSKNIHAGDSVTLNCTVHTGSCDGEHRVYWFKDSTDSHPGLIYTHGGRNDQCERKNNTQTHSCVYELNMENLTESHSGIYYCAVASCGHILFGNGTKLDLTGDKDSDETPVLVYLFIGSVIAIISLVVFVIFLLYKIKQSNKLLSTEERSEATSTKITVQEAEGLQYATVNVKRMKRSKRQKSASSSHCVYASVREEN